MKKTDLSQLAREDAFNLIGKEWMLVTAGTLEHYNTMTASWGGIGWLWNKPVAFVFIRPERFTHQFIEENERMTLSFLGEEHRDILNFCGSKSATTIKPRKQDCNLSRRNSAASLFSRLVSRWRDANSIRALSRQKIFLTKLPWNAGTTTNQVVRSMMSMLWR